jgi:hypothetical protein
MADKKISALTAATTPLAGTEVLPIVQSGATVKVAVSDLTAGRSVAMQDLTIASTSGSGLLSVTRTGIAGLVIAADGSGPLIWPTTVDNIQIYNKAITTQIFALNTSNGNLTAQTGNFVPATAGKGVNFTANTPAAGMTSQLLNWYEEGTFTPTLSGSTGDPTSTYTAQVGKYTRVGNLVTIYIQLFTSSYTGGSGTLQIKALPFAAPNGARFNINTVRITFGVTATQICAAVDGASTTMYFDESNSGLNDTVLSLSAWNSGAAAGMTVFGSYTV